jgi:electron transport complex protein RnfG
MNKVLPDPSLASRHAWIRVYLVVVGIGMICSFAIATTYESTRNIIARNRADAFRVAVTNVLPGAVSITAFHYDSKGDFVAFDEKSEQRDRVIAGFDDQGQLVGIAVEASGYGYQDLIHLLYGYSPDKEAITGFQVLESRETPGLGDRVETDKTFHDRIVGLEVALDESGVKLANPIAFVQGRSQLDPWEVDGVTGATVTSRAIVSILSGSTVQWVPRIVRHVEHFRNQSRERHHGN